MTINLEECCRDGGCSECGKYSHCSHHCPVSEGLHEFTIEERETRSTFHRVYATDKESAQQQFDKVGGEYLSDHSTDYSLEVFQETSD